jgi:hypothetical protein
MAITLNGSTGITSANIADGTIAAGDLGFSTGKLLQASQATYSTGVINNTSTYVDSGLTVSITPSSSSSKILIQASVPFQLGTNGGNGQLQFRIVRGSTPLISNLSTNNVQYIVQLALVQTLMWIDTPSTTSETTYKIQFRELSMSGRYGNSATIPAWNDSQTGVIQVMEIAA